MLLMRSTVAVLTVIAATTITVALGVVAAGFNKGPFDAFLVPSVVVGVAWGAFLAVRNWGHEWGRPRS